MLWPASCPIAHHDRGGPFPATRGRRAVIRPPIWTFAGHAAIVEIIMTEAPLLRRPGALQCPHRHQTSTPPPASS